jgi:AcrR family transcriptional regulator
VAEAARNQGDRGTAVGRAQATREALIELAAELFAERGYDQISIRDIARAGSLTTGAIYGHFRNKADLLAEAINVRTAEELESETLALNEDLDYIEALTRLGRESPGRRNLRALIVQGAAAAQTDELTRDRLRDEQLAHIDAWVEGFEVNRDRMGIDPGVDLRAAILYAWACEVGLGVLESLGIEPNTEGWADAQNRLARSLQLPPDKKKRKAPAALRRKRR